MRITKRASLWLRRRNDYRGTFTSPTGERVLEDLADFCGHTKSSFVPGLDATAMAYNEGKRSVYLHVLKMMAKRDDEIVAEAKRQERRAGEADLDLADLDEEFGVEGAFHA